jgi:predicted nucleic acid-binding protein
MIVVADTSPLNYLVLLGHIEILAKIYAEIVVPRTVLDELQDSDAVGGSLVVFGSPGMVADQHAYLSARPPHGETGPG